MRALLSELGLIQTPRQNKLKFDKARLISIIRNEVRERNRRESDIGEYRRQKELVGPAERPKQQMHEVSDLTSSLSALADVTDVDYRETVGAVDFWLDAIDDIEDDGDIVNNVGDEEWYVYDPELEPVPVANRSQELPDIKSPSFPQEKLLTGSRAQPVTLETVFSSWVELPAVAASQ
ncbi:hypothetical protein GN958_ATG18079 [Phytophthora infestans]|uniref:Uncharacterized protein n=1 Tax=Phytophthora infestans TaxID=4787 RepID=A0A8S9TVQ3_PHYIN|nr:hypothetical protein GN958_ATG18079 [Phytophthora infestans]